MKRKDIQNKIVEYKSKFDQYLAEDKLVECKELQEKITTLNTILETGVGVEDDNKVDETVVINKVNVKPVVNNKLEAVNKFVDNLKKPLVFNGSTTIANERDSLVPTDVSRELVDIAIKRDSLLNLFDVKETEVTKGVIPVLDLDSYKAVKLTKYTELGVIPNVDMPTFKKVAWEIENYLGITVESLLLLEDAPANVMEVLSENLRQAVANTVAEKALAIISGLSSTTIKDMIEFKKNFLKKVPKAVREGGSFVMNQNTYAEVATMTDSNGRFYITENPAVQDGYVLFGYPVVVVDNLDLADNKIAFLNGKKTARFIYNPNNFASIVIDKSAYFNQNAVGVKTIARFTFAQLSTGAGAMFTLSLGA